jgi:predicted ThiF/HesA family dinucleotide-utilizing enzyme
MKSRLLFAGCACWAVLLTPLSASGQPPLSITNAPGVIVVSWPAATPNWILESSTVMPPSAPWIPVSPASYQGDGVTRSVRIEAPAQSEFYRLRRLNPGVPGLSAHWRLDEGAGQLAGNETFPEQRLLLLETGWSAGRVGPGSLQFNGGTAAGGGSRAWVGNSDYRVLPAAGQPFSVSLWFCPDALTAGWRGILGDAGGESNGWRVALHTPGPGTNHLIFTGGSEPGSLSVTGRTLLLPGQWHQLTVTHDGAEGSLYLDSALLARGAGPIRLREAPIYFGGGVGGYDSFLGRIDDLRAYTNCLSPEQVALRGHWRFNENLGSFLADASVHEHHASATDPAARAPGHEGAGLELGCSTAIIPNEQLTVLPPSGRPFSVSFWLRPEAMPVGSAGLMHCESGAGTGWRLAVEMEDSGQAGLHFTSTKSGGTLELRAPVPLSPGVWTKLDLTFSGGIASAYANGRKVSAASGAIRASPSPLVLGTAPGLTNFAGVIDELKIHGRELGESEIGPVASVMWETVLMNTATNIPLHGSGPDGKPLTYSLVPVIAPTNGTVSLVAGSSRVTYTAFGRKGPDAFTYTVSDGEFTTPPTIVAISVVEPHWLSPTGGVGALLDGSGPEQAWPAGAADALDAIWKTNNFYDCFFYAPGEYQTRGWKYYERSTANTGCKHIGSGSAGAGATTIKLVDVWEAWAEEYIFAPLHGYQSSHDFEVQGLALDCNGQNVPKFTRGEPVWIRVPLASPGPVGSVTLRWASKALPAGFVYKYLGRAADFSVSARRFGTNTFSTNFVAAVSIGQSNLVAIGAEADEILLQFDRRAAGIDHYAVAEIEIDGAMPSLPQALVPGGGESRLGPQYAAVLAVDDDFGTAWVSGPESQARIELPLAPGSLISQVNLHWNCRYVSGVGRFGPAAAFTLMAREESSGLYRSVPLVRRQRESSGMEAVTFGTLDLTNQVVTDRLILLLTEREQATDYYSLREVTLQDGVFPVKPLIPASRNSYLQGSYSVLRAFDRQNTTEWASGTQGMVGAISVWGNNLRFCDLKVIGFGTKSGRECFPFRIVSPRLEAPIRLGNVRVERCVFTDPATNNTEGVTVITMAGNPTAPQTNAVIRQCTVAGLRSRFTTTQAATATHLEDCLVTDCNLAVYFEPEPAVADLTDPVLIRSNRFVNVDSGVYVATHPSAKFDSITCSDNEIVLFGRRGWGVAICDTCYIGSATSTTNLTVLNNIIRYADWGERPAFGDGGLYCSDIQHAVFGNNLVALGTPGSLRVRGCPSGTIYPPPGDCDHFVPDPPPPPTSAQCLDVLPAGYRRAWFNNRNLSGAMIPVRLLHDGVEGLAAQQQWPE